MKTRPVSRSPRAGNRLFLIFLALGLTAPLYARVGETLPQLESRFGPQFEAGADELDSSNKRYGFDKEGTSALGQHGFSAFAVIDFRGVCTELSYVKLAGRQIDADELSSMLTANSRGMGWKSEKSLKGPTIYVRTDGLVGWLARPDCFILMAPERAEARGLREWDS